VGGAAWLGTGGVGVRRNPLRYLKVGDVVRVEIERIGYLENPVIEEPADTVRL
jgi:2-keto-4-pentenoate hydratase/2-oxohepta-3-ene-1,7-dioic acid hydratase in catechol pathway